MKKITLHQSYQQLLADTFTPVSIYLKIRDKFANSILLESSDYHAKHNRFSYICCQPIAYFQANALEYVQEMPDEPAHTQQVSQAQDVLNAWEIFSQSFELYQQHQLPFVTNGLFGYCTYDAVQYFEQIKFRAKGNGDNEIPAIYYQVFRYVIVIDHFKDELYVFDNQSDKNDDGLTKLVTLIQTKNFAAYHFSLNNTEKSNVTDNEFLDILAKGQEHCFRGDVFQIVLSRRFERKFQGVEF
ncbi:MAG: anthranilate synthase component I family protein, partial [Thermoflexibacteraceae bacterium]